MRPAPLAKELEERGFESLWVPEHTHIPSSRKTQYPAGGGLIRPYYDIMDPFLVLNAAATATDAASDRVPRSVIVMPRRPQPPVRRRSRRAR